MKFELSASEELSQGRWLHVFGCQSWDHIYNAKTKTSAVGLQCGRDSAFDMRARLPIARRYKRHIPLKV